MTNQFKLKLRLFKIHDPNGLGGKPLALFESGATLM